MWESSTFQAKIDDLLSRHGDVLTHRVSRSRGKENNRDGVEGGQRRNDDAKMWLVVVPTWTARICSGRKSGGKFADVAN